MTSLHETLPILAEAVPALPGKVHEVAVEAEALRDAVQGALEEFAKRRQQVQELSGQLVDALMPFNDDVHQDQQQLRTALEELEASMRDGLVQHLDEGADSVDVAVDEATGALSGLGGHLASAAGRVQAAQDETEGAFQALGASVRQGKDELEGGLQTLSADLDAVEQELQDGRAKVDEGVTALGELMANLVEQARARMQAASAHLSQLASDHEGAVGEALAELTSGREELLKEWKESLGSDVEQPVLSSLSEVETALQELGRRAAEAEERSRGEREEAASEAEAVGQRLPPLATGVENVKQAAVRVGLDFA